MPVPPPVEATGPGSCDFGAAALLLSADPFIKTTLIACLHAPRGWTTPRPKSPRCATGTGARVRQWILACRVRTWATSLAKWKGTPVRRTAQGLGPWDSEPAALLHAAQFHNALEGGYQGGGGRKRAALQIGAGAAGPKRTRRSAAPGQTADAQVKAALDDMISRLAVLHACVRGL